MILQILYMAVIHCDHLDNPPPTPHPQLVCYFLVAIHYFMQFYPERLSSNIQENQNN